MKKTDPPICIEHVLNCNVDTGWSVITELDHMQKWFFDNIPSFEVRVGFETRFTVFSEERAFPHIWKITHVETLKKISYNWKYEGYVGESFVHFELNPENGNTRIKLITEIVEDFPQDIPEFKIESCIGGWNYFIKESLPKYLDSLS